MAFFPKPYADFVQRLRVPAGFVFLACFLWFAVPVPASLAWGAPVVIAGLALRAWAAGHLRKNQELACSGPYAYTRNPLYLGSLVMTAGFLWAAQRWELAVLGAAVFGLIYLPVIDQESQHLAKLFPEYRAYAARVPLLLPWPGPPGGQAFSWQQYGRNQEHQAVMAAVVGYAVLVAKAYWLVSPAR
jgi:protein-S-isoprenylcysteine O-methyltransferase Ste14